MLIDRDQAIRILLDQPDNCEVEMKTVRTYTDRKGNKLDKEFVFESQIERNGIYLMKCSDGRKAVVISESYEEAPLRARLHDHGVPVLDWEVVSVLAYCRKTRCPQMLVLEPRGEILELKEKVKKLEKENKDLKNQEQEMENWRAEEL